MVAAAAVFALQLAGPVPPGLAAAHQHLAVADTAAAARELGTIAADQRLTPDAVAALFLLQWMARGGADEPALRQWKRLREPHIRLRRDLRSGRLLAGGRLEEALGDALIVQRAVEQGRTGAAIGVVLFPDRTPPDWRVLFDARAAELERTDDGALAAGALRWVRVRELLVVLDSAASVVSDVARCEPDCFRVGQPQSDFRLLARLQAAGRDPVLAELATLFAGLARAPWPFNALGARAHVAVCALTRSSVGVAGCWPEDGQLDALGDRDAAEVRAMAFVFRGQHALAARVMDDHPAAFAALDSTRDLVDLPPGVRIPSRPYTPVLAPRGRDRRLTPMLLWRAAWPMYLVPYNERLVIHRARLLLADVVWRLAVDDAPGLFAPFGRPFDLVQVGVPLGAAVTRSGAILAYYPEGTHETAPQTGAGGAPLPLDLALVAIGSRGTRLTGFTSDLYDVFEPLGHQVVQYVRDGHRQVDVYTTWIGGACPQPRPLLGFFLLDSQLHELRRTTIPDPGAGKRIQLRLTLHPALYVYSVELLDRACRRAERARYVLRVPPVEGAMLSDLMLADELHYGDGYRGADRLRDRQPATIRPALDFEAGGTARFYWEMYGIAADTLTAGRLRVEFAVVSVRQERVAIRDLGRVAEEASAARPTLDVSYVVSVPGGDGPLASGLAVGLPPEARGVHIARVTVTDTQTGRTAQAERAFFVRG